MSDLRKDFGTITLVMIPVAIAINIAVGQLDICFRNPALPRFSSALCWLVCWPDRGLVR